ncbi:MAG: proton-conducting transporter membrane subunit [Pseudomonadota bacterium]
MSLLLLTVPLLPWLLALGLVSDSVYRKANWLIPCAALPALAVSALFPSGTSMDLPWLLLGSSLGIETPVQLFLALMGAVWLGVALVVGSGFHDKTGRRLAIFYLLAMGGSLGLILARDPWLFFFFASVSGYALYGLILHQGSDEARKAGRRYLVVLILGDLLLFEVLVTLAAEGGDFSTLHQAMTNPDSRDLLVGLVLVGFAVKAGLFPLHLWAPLAYRAVPVALLPLLLAYQFGQGVLGWIYWLPLGEVALPTWGFSMQVVGVASLLFGLLVGMGQVRARSILAYISVALAGLVIFAMGRVLEQPDSWPMMPEMLYFVVPTTVCGMTILWLMACKISPLRCWLNSRLNGWSARRDNILRKLPDIPLAFLRPGIRWLNFITNRIHTTVMVRLPTQRDLFLTWIGRKWLAVDWERTLNSLESQLGQWSVAISFLVLLGGAIAVLAL